jgi:hypothetical protein
VQRPPASRELTFREEEYPQAWASDLKALLRARQTATDHARTGGQRHLAPGVRADFLERYQVLVKARLAATPPPGDEERRPGTGTTRATAPAARALSRLERLLLQRDEVLAFLDARAMTLGR